MRKIAFSFAFFLAIVVNASQMCVTFDDLPAVRASNPVEAQEITVKLLHTITTEKIPAVGFVNQNKLEIDGRISAEMVSILNMWMDAGLELGNHTYSHMDLHNHSLKDYEEDVIRGEDVVRELLKNRGMQLRYFRHPYLHTGTDLKTKRNLSEFLAQRGYTVAPVTIDNAEWIFALAYDRSGSDQKPKIVDSYIEYMSQKLAFFENESQKLLGRNIRQILLLHANRLNADHLPMLIEMIRKKGYEFITLNEALQDEAYQLPDTFTGKGGISWLHRWAITRKVSKDFFQGEPAAPPLIMEAAGVKEE
jgi:peptidoglycan/xylan/chitin deacetylase (PgdA/CDA1 family)